MLRSMADKTALPWFSSCFAKQFWQFKLPRLIRCQIYWKFLLSICPGPGVSLGLRLLRGTIHLFTYRNILQMVASCVVQWGKKTDLRFASVE